MEKSISGKKVAILSEHGFEESELLEPLKALKDAGADVKIVSPQSGEIKGWNKTDWGKKVSVDVLLDDAKVDDFDALMLPGGVANPDRLRMNPKAVEFAKQFFDSGKPIAAICHGPQLLINADVVRGRKMTSWPSLKTDLVNAGADWVDEEVVTDKGLVTSRKPDDIPAFNRKMIEEIAEGLHANRRAARAESQRATPPMH